jgi:hypothetical protein
LWLKPLYCSSFLPLAALVSQRYARHWQVETVLVTHNMPSECLVSIIEACDNIMRTVAFFSDQTLKRFGDKQSSLSKYKKNPGISRSVGQRAKQWARTSRKPGFQLSEPVLFECIPSRGLLLRQSSAARHYDVLCVGTGEPSKSAHPWAFRAAFPLALWAFSCLLRASGGVTARQ